MDCEDPLIARDRAIREAVERRYQLLLDVDEAGRRRHPRLHALWDACKAISTRAFRIALGVAVAYFAWHCWLWASDSFSLHTWTLWTVVKMLFWAWCALAFGFFSLAIAFGPAGQAGGYREDLMKRAFEEVNSAPRYPREY